MAAAVPQAQPTFHLQTAEDDMEISSDVGRDQDIDIDIDVDHSFTPRAAEDDIMQDDARSQEEIAHQSDMTRDINIDEIGDGAMADETIDFTFEDEHLTDASELDPVDQNLAQITTAEDSGNDHSDNKTYEATLYSSLFQKVEPVSTELSDALANEIHTAGSDAKIDDIEDASIKRPHTENENQLDIHFDRQISRTSSPRSTRSNGALSALPAQLPDPSDNDNQEVHSLEEVASHFKPENEELDIRGESPPPESTLHEFANEQSGLALEPNRDVQKEEDESSQDNENHSSFEDIHPVVVLYDNDKVSLFPPQNSDLPEQFFLQDRSYAQKSLKELLQACREVLGSTVAEEEDLELSISDLGLTIRENSIEDHSVCFSDILEVYLDLQRHDGVDYPDPLYVSLIRSKRFSSTFDLLRQAVKDGKGLAELAVTHYQDDEPDPAENEDYTSSEKGEESDHSDASSHQQIDTGSNQTNEDSDSYANEDALPLDTYEVADYAESDEQAPSANLNSSAGSQVDANDTQDEFVNTAFDDEDDEDEESGFGQVEEVASDMHPVSVAVGDTDTAYDASLTDYVQVVDDATLDTLGEDKVYYEEDKSQGPGEESSSPSTLQGERSHQDFDKIEPPFDDLQTGIGFTQDEALKPHSTTEQLGQGDEHVDQTINTEGWIPGDVSDKPSFAHDAHPHTIANGHHHNEHMVTKHSSTDTAETIFDHGGEEAEEDTRLNAEGIDDWQVFLDGDGYAENNVDTANYELDVSAHGQLEGLPHLYVLEEGDNIEYHDTEVEPLVGGDAATGGSPSGKRTWDEQNDDQSDVLNEQDSKRARAD